MIINKSQNYSCYRYFKKMKPQLMKENLSREEAVEFCESHPTRKKRNGDFNSFVGFVKNN